jgi:hypothetical protein
MLIVDLVEEEVAKLFSEAIGLPQCLARVLTRTGIA